VEPDVVTDRHGIRLRALLVVAVAVGGLSWIVLRLWTGGGHVLPMASWPGLLLLALMAAGVYAGGLPVKRSLAGSATKPLGPLAAARVLVLGQAAALCGAAVLGWYVAQVLIVLPDVDVDSQRARLVPLAALCAGGILLSGSGLLVQRMCRLGDDQRGSEDDEEG